MKLNLDTLELKQLNKSELKTLISWAKQEGWNPGENDAEVFWKTDPDGYYGFHYENELIAGGAIVSYGQAFGFMGLFIVRSDFRGQGIGTKLWYLRRDRLLARLKNGASIGMDGVVAMQDFYAEGDFKIAYTEERYESIGKEMLVNSAISPIKTNDYENIAKYDLACFGFKRSEFLQSWLTMSNSKCFKYTNANELAGYAVIRKVASGYKIGPLFANNYAIAEELYKACLNSAVGSSVYLDIPVINEDAVQLVKKYNGIYTFECGRMYYGEQPNLPTDKIFGVTTFELG